MKIVYKPERNSKNSGKQSHSQQPQKIKMYLRISLTKEVKDLYNENFETLKEIEEDT